MRVAVTPVPFKIILRMVFVIHSFADGRNDLDKIKDK